MLSKPYILGLCLDPTMYHGKGRGPDPRRLPVAKETRAEAHLLGGFVLVSLIVPSVWESCLGSLPTQEAADLYGPHLSGTFPL